MVLVPLGVIPGLGFLAQEDWLRLLAQVSVFAVAALGLNVLTGLAGQVSLGHAFFMGVGAYTAAWLGAATGPFFGLGLPIWVWLPAAGLIAAIIGVAVGPTAVRVRGLYLAFVTLGLVFVGEYLFRNWTSLTGGAQNGRVFPPLEIKLWKEEQPLINFHADGSWFGVDLSGNAKAYYFLLAIAVVFVILLPRLVEDITNGLAGVVQHGSGPIAWLGDLFISTGGGDFGFVNTQAGVAPGLSIAQLNQVLYGLLIIGFLIFEPLGLYGIWLRIRNYWKGWPFTY
jgi:branched-chain amino acid transport system permease protein